MTPRPIKEGIHKREKGLFDEVTKEPFSNEKGSPKLTKQSEAKLTETQKDIDKGITLLTDLSLALNKQNREFKAENEQLNLLNKKLHQENEDFKELAKKNNDWNIVTANLAQRKTIDILKQQLLDKTSSEEGLRKAIKEAHALLIDDPTTWIQVNEIFKKALKGCGATPPIKEGSKEGTK